MKEPFGEYLKKLRKAKRYSTYELAEASGVSQSLISQLENKPDSRPTPNNIRKLSKALGVTHIGMMIKAGYVTEEEVLTLRAEPVVSPTKPEMIIFPIKVEVTKGEIIFPLEDLKRFFGGR